MKAFEPGTLCFFYRHYPGKRAETAMRGRHLRPAALSGPHGRSSWWVRFGGRAYLCATETLARSHARRSGSRGPVTKEDSWPRLLPAAREVPENCEDLGLPPPVEVPTDPPGEPAEPSRDDLDIGIEAVEPITSFGRSKRNRGIHRSRRATNFVEET